MPEHVQFGCVGQAYNVKVDRQVSLAMSRAQGIDSTRLQIVRVPSVDGYDSVEVAFMTKDKSAVQYTMSQPHLRHACCSCAVAQQTEVCKHQLAAILALYPHPDTAKIVVFMLGTRFGHPGGCNFDSLSLLVDRLAGLCTQPCSSQLNTQPEVQPAARLKVQARGNILVESDQCDTLMPRTYIDFQRKLQENVHVLDNAVRVAPTATQCQAMTVAMNHINAAISIVRTMSLDQYGDLSDFVADGPFSARRMPYFLEKPRKRSRQAGDGPHANTHAVVASHQAEYDSLEDFQQSGKRDTSMHYSACFDAHRSVMQAAAHVGEILRKQHASAPPLQAPLTCAGRHMLTSSIQNVVRPCALQTPPICNVVEAPNGMQPLAHTWPIPNVEEVLQVYAQQGASAAPTCAQYLLARIQTQEEFA